MKLNTNYLTMKEIKTKHKSRLIWYQINTTYPYFSKVKDGLEKTFSKNLLDSRETGSVVLVEECNLATDRLKAQVEPLLLLAPIDQVVLDGSVTDHPAYLA